MNRNIIMAAMALVVMPAAAQETYENAKLAGEDLNGTARYVGMGGAMEALGADLSTIGTNPAGIGLFRRSTASVSFGFVSQQGGKSFDNASTSNASFDQAGFVYAMRTGSSSFLNVAFNYHKSKNFNYILSAAGALNGSSQNMLSFIKGVGLDNEQGASTWNIDDSKDVLMGTNSWTSQLDNLYYNNFIFGPDKIPGYNTASGYRLNRAHSGYIGQYDFNISGNIGDRIYLGLTTGIHDVHYKAYGEYTEDLLDKNNQPVGNLTVADDRSITGTGFDIKAGIIFRPIETSPLRIGLSVATPTWYSLTTSNYTTMKNATSYKGYHPTDANNSYSFKLYTPWIFGASIGHTVGDFLALGASYQYADYGRLDTRVNDGDSYDPYWDSYYTTSSSDENMNRHTRQTLKGVSTIKLGAEFKPTPALALRAGYNHESAMYATDGEKDVSIDSYGTNYSTTTDFTNWKATNRITFGVGYTVKSLSIDVAYQYSATNGVFRPFIDASVPYNYLDANNKIVTETVAVHSDGVNVSNKRHQLLLTIGYRF